MRKLLFYIMFLLSFNAQAERPYFTYGNPGLIIEAGGNPGAGNVNHGLNIELETNVCDSYHFCYNPFLVQINNQRGGGIDAVHKVFKRWNNNLKVSAGVLSVDGERGFHGGLSFEIYSSRYHGFIVSYDHYDVTEPINLFSFGVHFR